MPVQLYFEIHHDGEYHSLRKVSKLKLYRNGDPTGTMIGAEKLGDTHWGLTFEITEQDQLAYFNLLLKDAIEQSKMLVCNVFWVSSGYGGPEDEWFIDALELGIATKEEMIPKETRCTQVSITIT